MPRCMKAPKRSKRKRKKATLQHHLPRLGRRKWNQRHAPVSFAFAFAIVHGCSATTTTTTDPLLHVTPLYHRISLSPLIYPLPSTLLSTLLSTLHPSPQPPSLQPPSLQPTNRSRPPNSKTTPTQQRNLKNKIKSGQSVLVLCKEGACGLGERAFRQPVWVWVWASFFLA